MTPEDFERFETEPVPEDWKPPAVLKPPPLPGWSVYIFPWRYRGWAQQIPILHLWRFHVAFHKMGRRQDWRKFWLPNLSIHYLPPFKSDHNL